MKCRILIIDDNEDIRLLLHTLLERIGYEVYEATNGDEGIQRLKTEHPEVVITDLAMPNTNGFKMLEHLRHNYPGTKVIVITGMDDETVRPVAQGLGVFRILFKPFRNAEILQAVGEALNGNKLTQS